MTRRSRQAVLITLNAAMALAAAAAAFWAFAPFTPPPAPPPPPGATAQAAQPPGARPLGDYAVIHALNLRRPLFDPAPPPPPPPAPPPRLNLKLAGTVVEPGHTFAIIQSGSSTTFVAVGDTIEGATLKHVDESTAIFEFAGRDVTLTTAKEPPR